MSRAYLGIRTVSPVSICLSVRVCLLYGQQRLRWLVTKKNVTGEFWRFHRIDYGGLWRCNFFNLSTNFVFIIKKETLSKMPSKSSY